MAILIIIISFLLAPYACAEQLLLDCGKSELCDSYKEKINYYFLQANKKDIAIDDYIGLVFRDGGISNPVFTEDDGVSKLEFKLKPRVQKFRYEFIGEAIDGLAINLHNSGEILTNEKIEENLVNIDRSLKDLGYDQGQVKVQKIIQNDLAEVIYIVNPGQPTILNNIIIESTLSWTERYLRKKIQGLEGQPFNKVKILNAIENTRKELFDLGFWMLTINYRERADFRLKKDLYINMNEGRLFSISLEQQKIDETFKQELLGKLFKFNTVPGVSDFDNFVISYYEERAFKGTVAKTKRYEYLDINSIPNTHYKIKIKKGIQTKVRNIYFKGNIFFSEEKLKSLYFENASDLAGANRLDRKYLDDFSNILKKLYIEHGFASVHIKPVKLFELANNKVDVYFDLKESPRTFIDQIRINGVTNEENDELMSLIELKPSMPFNPYFIDSDIAKIRDYFLKKGYYFVKTKSRPKDTVKYSTDFTSVDITFRVEKGVSYKLDSIILVGAKETKAKIIYRNIGLKSGDIFSPDRYERAKAQLSSTGLFSSIRLEPIFHSVSGEVDLIVLLEEKEFGSFILAPGYRTDLGAKISSALTYTNLFGLNHSISLNAQINQRLNFSTLDSRRRDEGKEMLEYLTRLTYGAPMIFDSNNDFYSSISIQRRRFFSFDADISRFSNSIKRPINNILTLSLTHQLEDIEQYDASNAIDNGQFNIGSVTPGFSIDLRDNIVNPTKGAWFNLSAEYASPDFLSDDDIKYVKWISRNRFYFPIPNGVFATSLTLGLQENLAQQGSFIPNIKVFRLAGTEIVRGFSFDEINRLKDGSEISDSLVTDKAYMTNIKLEPRFFINDSMMWGVFLDAGRIQVGEYDATDLRTSAGLSFRYVTPVGAFSIDYGIKLLRKDYADGTVESPGRLHINIGFF